MIFIVFFWIVLVDVVVFVDVLQQGGVCVFDVCVIVSIVVCVVDVCFLLGDLQLGVQVYVQGYLFGVLYVDFNCDLVDMGKYGQGCYLLLDSVDFVVWLGQWGIVLEIQVVVYDVGDGSMVVVWLWWLLWLIGYCWVVVFDGGLVVWQVVGLVLIVEVLQVLVLLFYFGQFDCSQIVLVGEVVVCLKYVLGWLLDVWVGECFCGEVELLDFIVGYVFGVVNCLFVLNVYDGCLCLVVDLQVVLCLLIGIYDLGQVVLMCGLGVIVCYLLLVMEVVGLYGVCIYVDLWSGWVSDFSCLVVIGF